MVNPASGFDTALLAANALTDFKQFSRSIVRDFAFIVNEAVDLGEDDPLDEDVLNQRLDSWCSIGTFGVAIAQDGFNDIQRRL